MKQCPRCGQTYSDDQLNFCLDDGELLSGYAREPPPTQYADDAPPTVMLNDARRTNPANWPSTQPVSPPVQWQPQSLQNPLFSAPAYMRSRDQTLPTIALILGIISLPMICCYGGIWLGLPAAVLGFVGMRNADGDNSRYGGRGMAIGGMVLGVMSLLTSIVILFFAILAR